MNPLALNFINRLYLLRDLYLRTDHQHDSAWLDFKEEMVMSKGNITSIDITCVKKGTRIQKKFMTPGFDVEGYNELYSRIELALCAMNDDKFIKEITGHLLQIQKEANGAFDWDGGGRLVVNSSRSRFHLICNAEGYAPTCVYKCEIKERDMATRPNVFVQGSTTDYRILLRDFNSVEFIAVFTDKVIRFYVNKEKHISEYKLQKLN